MNGLFEERSIGPIERRAFAFEQAVLDLDAGGGEAFEASSCRLRRRVCASGHHPRHAGRDQPLRARRRARAAFAAGLEGDIGHSAPRRITGRRQGLFLGVGPARASARPAPTPRSAV